MADAEPIPATELAVLPKLGANKSSSSSLAPKSSIVPPPPSASAKAKQTVVRLPERFSSEDLATMAQTFNKSVSKDYHLDGKFEIIVIADTFDDENDAASVNRSRLGDDQRAYIYVRNTALPIVESGYEPLCNATDMWNDSLVLGVVSMIFTLLDSRIWAKARAHILATFIARGVIDQQLGAHFDSKTRAYARAVTDDMLSIYNTMSERLLEIINDPLVTFKTSARAAFESRRNNFEVESTDAKKKHTTRLLAFRNPAMAPRIWFVRHEEIKPAVPAAAAGKIVEEKEEKKDNSGDEEVSGEASVEEVKKPSKEAPRPPTPGKRKELEVSEAEEEEEDDDGDFAAVPKSSSSAPAKKKSVTIAAGSKDENTPSASLSAIAAIADPKERKRELDRQRMAAKRQLKREEKARAQAEKEKADLIHADEELARAISKAEEKQAKKDEEKKERDDKKKVKDTRTTKRKQDKHDEEELVEAEEPAPKPKSQRLESVVVVPERAKPAEAAPVSAHPPSVAPPAPVPASERKHAFPANFFGEPRYKVYPVVDAKGEPVRPERFAVQDTTSKVITNRTIFSAELKAVERQIIGWYTTRGAHEECANFKRDMHNLNSNDYFSFELLTDEDGFLPQDAGSAIVHYGLDNDRQLLTGIELGSYVDDVALLCKLRGMNPQAVRDTFEAARAQAFGTPKPAGGKGSRSSSR